MTPTTPSDFEEYPPKDTYGDFNPAEDDGLVHAIAYGDQPWFVTFCDQNFRPAQKHWTGGQRPFIWAWHSGTWTKLADDRAVTCGKCVAMMRGGANQPGQVYYPKRTPPTTATTPMRMLAVAGARVLLLALTAVVTAAILGAVLGN